MFQSISKKNVKNEVLGPLQIIYKHPLQDIVIKCKKGDIKMESQETDSLTPEHPLKTDRVLSADIVR